MEKRNKIIDVMKGICIVFVTISHCEWSSNERLNFAFPFWIDMAVPIFMIISGYVTYCSYSKRNYNLKECYNINNILTKLFRYFFPYLLFFLMYVWCRNTFYADVTFKWIIKECIVGGSGPGGYYIPILFQFVFIYPFIYFFVKKYDEKGVAMLAICNLMYEILQWKCELNEAYYRLLIFRYVFILAWGSYLASNKYKKELKIYILFQIVGMIFIFLNCYFGYKPPIVDKWTRTSFVACLYIIPIISIIIKSHKLSFTLLESIGKASYNIYLYQMLFFCYFSNYVYKYIPCRLLQMSCCVILCLIFGYIFYLLEKKIISCIKRLISRFKME